MRNQEFFSDGMTEEITSALAMVRRSQGCRTHLGVSVQGRRTSDIRTVAAVAGRDASLEGSVRKDGNRVRITAQLIEAGSGTHLWSENYDRQFSDIFATQEEIATAIAGRYAYRLAWHLASV